MKTCIRTNCNRPVLSRELCQTHYNLWYRQVIKNSAEGTANFPKAKRKHSYDEAMKIRNETIADLYRGGMTLSQVGAEEGITKERVRQVLISMGVERRPPGRNQVGLVNKSDRLEKRVEDGQEQEFETVQD